MLAYFWLAVLALSLGLYMVLSGYDIGVGMLSGLASRAGGMRGNMVASISPLGDGNGTWLVIAGTVLFGAFPAAYSILLSALYLPLAGMLAGLVIRGVAIEFRHKAASSRWVWDATLCAGSLLAAVMQGVAIGTYAAGLPVTDLRYAGNGFEWLAPFPLACGAVLALGYALLGAGWLTLKGRDELQAFGTVAVRRLAPVVMLGAAGVFAATLRTHVQVGERWAQHPVLMVLPVLGLASLAHAWRLAARRPAAGHPFAFIAAGSVFMLLTLAGSNLPELIPFGVTLQAAAAPAASLQFMFWGAGLFVLPMVVAYTWVVYAVFSGKSSDEDTYH